MAIGKEKSSPFQNCFMAPRTGAQRVTVGNSIRTACGSSTSDIVQHSPQAKLTVVPSFSLKRKMKCIPVNHENPTEQWLFGRVSLFRALWGAKKKDSHFRASPYGSPNWARTSDIMINSHALYRLSYRGIWYLGSSGGSFDMSYRGMLYLFSFGLENKPPFVLRGWAAGTFSNIHRKPNKG